MKVTCAYVIGCTLWVLQCFAQHTHTLEAVEINAHSKSVDTIDLKSRTESSLTQVLSQQSGLLLRNYGPGASAGIAIRGGSTAQTQVFWHGFSIQHPMLGMTDASALPVFLFDKIRIERNASQAIQQTRSGFSSVQLDDHIFDVSAQKNTLLISGSSLKNLDLGFKTRVQLSKLSLSTKIYHKRYQNSYFWFPGSQLLTCLNHGAEQQFHMMQDIAYRMALTHTLELHAWAYNILRQVSFTPEQAANKTGIQQQVLNIVGNWNSVFKRFQSKAVLGYSSEIYNYTDSISRTTSLHGIHGFQHHFQGQVQLTPLQIFKAGFTGNFNEVRSTSYAEKGIQYQPNLWISHDFSKYKMALQSVYRIEMTGKHAVPFSFLEQFSYNGNSFLCKASIGRQWRWSSLNERFWQPGGNLHLNPEMSLGGDINFRIMHLINKWRFELSQSAFIKNIKNWITWLPGAGAQAQVVNINAVHNRGLESSIVIRKNFKRFEMEIAAQWNCAYTFTISNENRFDINARGLQWIYTPLYSGSGYLQCKTPYVLMQWQIMYTGYSYTSSDHHSWINPFWINNLKLQRHHFIGQHYQIQYSLQCDNLFDNPNQWIVGKPLPGRQFLISTQFNF